MTSATRSARIALGSAAAGIALLLLSAPAQVEGARLTHLKEATMIIEFNSSAQDIGIQFFLDGEGWQSIEIFDPAGEAIFAAAVEGRLVEQGGGTELFLESVEPPLDELPLAEFFDRFPAGTYRFRGVTTEGERVTGRAEFTHDVPAGPTIVTPVGDGGGCGEDAPIPTVIEWEPVTTSIFGEPLAIVGYEVIVEGDDVDFDVHLPADDGGVSVTVPAELLEPGEDYRFEVLAIEASGNQTITEGCFSTAP